MIDHVRRVAPRISIVSSAVCLSGVTYFGSGQPYSQLARIMPIHPGIDDIAYSIHLYNPGALMMGTAQNALYKPGTIIHYPFQRIPESAGLNDEARYSIRMYNRTNPDAEYFDKVFRDIATFSETHDIRIMVTETGAPNPTFGLPREDRIALFRDLITHSKQYDVPLNYHFVGSEWGLSSCHHIVGVADHRFDPALMNLIAFGNSVPGAKPDAPIEALEVQCGPPVKYLTDEIVDESNSPANWIHGIFRLVVAGAEGSSKFNDFGVQGTYSDFNHNISGLSFTIIQPALDGDVPAALRACSGVSFPSWDGRNHLNFQVHAIGATLQVQGINCILENTEGEVAAMARLLGLDFKKVVADMVTTGSANAITNDDLRQWINDIADGSIIFESAED